MQQDTEKTNVYFVIEPSNIRQEGRKVIVTFDNPTALALFPDMIERDGSIVCYSHFGQHSSAGHPYIKHCKPATEDQYKNLKNELESIGYNLEIINGTSAANIII